MPPIPPQLAELLLVLAALVAVSVLVVLAIEFVLLRGVDLVYRLRGHPPPRQSMMSAAIRRLEEEARRR
jgi:hypothetical protein